MDNPQGRDFHGISTPRGGSYNSFLIEDKSPTIIDGTNDVFFDAWIGSLKERIDPSKIRYIVVNHAENDHTGALPTILDACPKAEVLCTKTGSEILKAAYGIERVRVVSDREEINIGKRTLQFFVTPMVHWPETMMTWIPQEKMLFSGDLFGTEVSHESMWADEMKDLEILTRDYATLVIRPFAHAAIKGIDKAIELRPDHLFPTHGPLYRDDISGIISYYDKLMRKPEEDKVLIAYASVWHETQKMAEEIAKGVEEKGSKVVLVDVFKENMVKIMAESLTSKAVALGSLTIIGCYHPIFEAVIPFLKLNAQKGKKTAVFGTHGWSPCSVAKLKEKMEGIGYDVIDTVDLRFGKGEDFNRLKEIGNMLGGVKLE